MLFGIVTPAHFVASWPHLARVDLRLSRLSLARHGLSNPVGLPASSLHLMICYYGNFITLCLALVFSCASPLFLLSLVPHSLKSICGMCSHLYGCMYNTLFVIALGVGVNVRSRRNVARSCYIGKAADCFCHCSFGIIILLPQM